VSPLRQTIDWQGITLSVGFTPNWHGTSIHHLELQVIAPEGAIITITETGYRSHFFSAWMETSEDVIDYARRWLDREANSPEWRRRAEAARQLSLF